MEAAVREKTRRPAQHTTAAPNFMISHTLRGRHLRYLIGQQRSQSSPHSVSKSSGNRTAIVGSLANAEDLNSNTYRLLTPVAAKLFPHNSKTNLFASEEAWKRRLNSASR